MKSISDWLDDKVDDIINTPGFEESSSAFEKEAEILRAQAEADGFTTKDLEDACGGDIAAYLMERQNALTQSEMRQKIEDDPYGK